MCKIIVFAFFGTLHIGSTCLVVFLLFFMHVQVVQKNHFFIAVTFSTLNQLSKFLADIH